MCRRELVCVGECWFELMNVGICWYLLLFVGICERPWVCDGMCWHMSAFVGVVMVCVGICRLLLVCLACAILCWLMLPSASVLVCVGVYWCVLA